MGLPRVHLVAVGSDPEFLFGRVEEFTLNIVPANTVILGPKEKSLTSFIGTDGHPATAELRPGPAHNIRRHLFDIAHGIVSTDDWLRRKLPGKGLRMFSSPYINGEPIGGHIHTSMFVDDPVLARLGKANLTIKNGSISQLDPSKPHGAGNFASYEIDELTAAESGNTVFSTRRYAQLMNWLGLPFEGWIQPWFSRVKRATKYGNPFTGNEDHVVRAQNSPRPERGSRYKGFHYVHYEYRMPSGWLNHPWLAYSYLALAKLTMLNVELIEPELSKDTLTSKHFLSSTASGNAAMLVLLEKRLADLMARKPLLSADLNDLERGLDECKKNREKWFVEHTPIATEAWRALL